MKNFKERLLSFLLAFVIVLTTCLTPVSFAVSLADDDNSVTTDMQTNEEKKSSTDENEDFTNNESEGSDVENTLENDSEVTSSDESQKDETTDDNENTDTQQTIFYMDNNITNITVNKLVDNIWKPATDFNENDTVRVEMKYGFKPGDLNTSNTKLVYKIPQAIKISDYQKGTIYLNDDKSNPIGSYEITTDGEVIINFDDGFVNPDEGFEGTVQFRASVSLEGTGDSGKVNFPGNSDEITIVKPDEPQENYDINVSKTGKVNIDRNKVSYTITIATNNGTEGEISISDQLDKLNSVNLESFNYDRDSLKIDKIDADGTTKYQ